MDGIRGIQDLCLHKIRQINAYNSLERCCSSFWGRLTCFLLAPRVQRGLPYSKEATSKTFVCVCVCVCFVSPTIGVLALMLLLGCYCGYLLWDTLVPQRCTSCASSHAPSLCPSSFARPLPRSTLALRVGVWRLASLASVDGFTLARVSLCVTMRGRNGKLDFVFWGGGGGECVEWKNRHGAVGCKAGRGNRPAQSLAPD